MQGNVVQYGIKNEIFEKKLKKNAIKSNKITKNVLSSS